MRRIALVGAGILGGLIAAALPGAVAQAAVSTTPAAVSIVAGRANTFTVTYRFTGLTSVAVPGPFNGLESSNQGAFFAPSGQNLGTIATLVSATIANGSGQASETVTVPPAVLDLLRSLGFSQLRFTRVFTGSGDGPQAVDVTVFLASDAAASFGVRRIELYFENRRGEITVKRNHRGLKAFADVRFSGSGQLTGYWEVDGRRILDVNTHLSFGTSVTLTTPDAPDLPTFDTGVHVVRFVVTSPATAFALPAALYFVTPAEEVRRVRITVPKAKAPGDAAGTRAFEWERPAGVDVFLVEFREKPAEKPVFSAFTKGNRYALPAGVGGIFTPGQTYYWQVKGYDAKDNQVGESPMTAFRY